MATIQRRAYAEMYGPTVGPNISAYARRWIVAMSVPPGRPKGLTRPLGGQRTT